MPNNHRSRPGREKSANDNRSQSRRAGAAPRPAARDRARPGQGLPIYGFHAVEAVLRNPRRHIHTLSLTENAEHRLKQALGAAWGTRTLEIERLAPKDLDRRLGAEAVHQGVLVEVEPLPQPDMSELAMAGADHRPVRLVVLDQVTDPHNVGAILRSAAVLSATGLIMTQRNSPELSGALAKAASGGLEHVPVALVTNLSRALAELGELGVERIGLDGDAAFALEAIGGIGAVALVLGAEGKGLRHLTRQHCDRLCAITAHGVLSSLNVSNAAAIALHTLALVHAGVIPRVD